MDSSAYLSLAALIYVTKTEHDAVARMYDWTETRYPGDEQTYLEFRRERNGKEELIVAARTDEMGMTAASVLSMKLIHRYRPRYLIMPGIAAGTKGDDADEQMYGDIVLADKIWNYSNGKYVSADQAEIVFGELGFIPRPTLIHTDPELKRVFERAVVSEKNECHVLLGTMASGSTVVANRAVLEKYVRSGFRETLGLEMEGYGVAYAARHATEPKPHAIVAKSVCDFADNRKSDMYQKFAAHTSCEFVRFLIEEIL